MANGKNFELQIFVSFLFCILCISIGSDPVDNYLIDCGSPRNTSVGNRVFVADNSTFNVSTPRTILAFNRSNSLPNSSTNDSQLYFTARLFENLSNYSFSINKTGRYFIRLHFFPFVYENYSMSSANFSVTAQNLVLMREYRFKDTPLVKEYSLDITSNSLILTFIPLQNSIAFVNAIEVISLPDQLIPESALNIDTPQRVNHSLQRRALETVARVNMGNLAVPARDDPLWRLWVSDRSNMNSNHLAYHVSSTALFTNSTTQSFDDSIAPIDVYATATAVNSSENPVTRVNITWSFDVDPGFEYLVRFHFCNIIYQSVPEPVVFNVYVNTLSAIQSLNLQSVGAPYHMDFVTRVRDSSNLNVSVGPPNPTALLNGLEVMKISNSKGSLDFPDSFPSESSKLKIALIVGLTVGFFIVLMLVLVLVLFLVCRKRERLVNIGHLKADDDDFNIKGVDNARERKFPNSEYGYRLPLVAILEATDNFSENLIVGVGGFGKVYKGVLRDGTEVAVKRGESQSHQGLSEFRTEIEMLSQFRHRHLVSLIGYCDEKNETIIIYDYMENGTLKSHLYGSDLPILSWRQRLEICIGSARGLHYLHTGSTKVIIHRDVKSANILLDENFMAKVSDFGLSKMGPDLNHTHVSTAVKGSFGYLDPEYLTMQQLTEKSDVYSFGVVMLEVLSGRPVIDPSLPKEEVNLVEWAMKRFKRGELVNIVDPRIINQINPESLAKFGEVIGKCLAECGIHRPSMGDVLWNLEYALQLQGNEGRTSTDDDIMNSSRVSVSQSDSSFSMSVQFSSTSLADIAGVSMSKVFAQMVRDDTRGV